MELVCDQTDLPGASHSTSDDRAEVESIDPANRVAVVQPGVSVEQVNEAVRSTPGGEFLRLANARALAALGQVREAEAGADNLDCGDQAKAPRVDEGGTVSPCRAEPNTLADALGPGRILGVEWRTPDGEVNQSGGGMVHDRIGPDVSTWLSRSGDPEPFNPAGWPSIHPGQIRRLWCGLEPIPEATRTVYARFDNASDAWAAVGDARLAGVSPSVVIGLQGELLEQLTELENPGNSKAPAECDPGKGQSGQTALILEIEGMAATLDTALRQVVDLCQTHQALDVEAGVDPRRQGEMWSAIDRAEQQTLRVTR